MQPVDIAGLKSGYADTGAAEVNAGAIGTIAPYASHMSGPVAPLAQYNAAPTSTASGSGLGKAIHFIGGIRTDIGHIAVGASKWLATNVASMATAIPREIQGISRGQQDNSQIGWNNQRSQQNSLRLSQLTDNYRTGRISRTQYQAGMKDLITSNNKITEDQIGLNARINSDKTDAYKAMIDTAALAVTLIPGMGELSLLPKGMAEALPGVLGKSTADVLGTKTAAEYLASTNANAMFSNVEAALTHFDNNPEAFGKLTATAQQALQKASAEVITQASDTATSGQIARAAAINLALKDPFYYNYLSTTGHQIYQQLDQEKYGAAMRTLGFNSLLLLSGGPIGQAMKYGGDALKGISDRTFTRTAFIDQISQGVGNGEVNGIYKAIMTHDFQDYKFFQGGKLVTLPEEEARARVIQNIKAVEATNLAATKGKDAVAAANRVLTGMQSYEGISMDAFTHEQFLKNMSDFAEAHRTSDFHVPGSAVGRVDSRDMQGIADTIGPTISGDSKASLKAWNDYKAANPTRAFANNDNFDRQMKGLIKSHSNPEDFKKAVQDIKTQYRVKGFPEDVGKQMTKLGYLPITPRNIEAPFKEGSAGAMESKFAGTGRESTLFKSAVKPLPVLSQIGGMLTGMGLSPLAAESATYQMYNSALAERLSGMTFSKGLTKDTAEGTSDNVLKTLSDWTKKLNSGEVQRGGFLGTKLRPPIMDLRQLMVKDTAAALKISMEQAKQVNSALRDAMLDVPLATRGLGDKVMDAANQSALFRSYIRVQGAGRFSWNPFFQAKLMTKTEALTQAVSGGKTPVIMENILGHGPQIESTRGLLRSNGLLDANSAKTKVFSLVSNAGREGGEASLEGVSVGANLSHSLLPMQEKSIAGMINRQAAKVGLTPAQFMEHFPTETRDTIQMIAQYDRNSTLLHSPLMRSLNLAFFPLRFETKVATIMAKSLAQTSTLTQVAVINGLMNAHSFMNSPEGMAWYSQNADVLKFINYFSPTMTLSTVGQLLTGLSHEDYKTTAGAFELGGLPFGWIPQILSDEGANFTPGYVDPGTGQVVAKQIPNSAKAKLQTAVQDLVGSLFTYPGAELGAPSKTGVDAFIAGGLIGGKAPKSQFTPTTPYLSAQQKQFSQTIQGQHVDPTQKQGPTSIAPSTNVKIAGSGTAAAVYKNGAPKTVKPKALKKGQYKASLPA